MDRLPHGTVHSHSIGGVGVMGMGLKSEPDLLQKPALETLSVEAEWISSAKACALVAAIRDIREAPHTIAQRAEAGLVRAVAERLVDGEKVDCNAPVPKRFWFVMRNIESRMDWRTGDFCSQRHNVQRHAFGVRFHREDIEATIRVASEAPRQEKPSQEQTTQASAVPSSRGGNPGKVSIWHQFWMEAMTMLDEGALDDRTRFPSQKSLMDELRHRIDDRLSEESVKPLVSKIWLKFVTREG